MTNDKTPTNATIDALYGRSVVDQSGNKIGEIGQVYLDDASGQPAWVTVKTGLFGRNETCLLYTSPSPRDLSTSRMPSSA